MTDTNAVAIVGVGAILPDAPDASAFWSNVSGGRYAISEVGADRWDPELYFDPDPKAPDRTYSKIGGWVREWEWDPIAWHLPIPPRVSEAIDDGQKWAVACTRMALLDYGWPSRELDLERTATVLGNAMAGEQHYLTSLRLAFPELARELDRAPSYAELPEDVRAAIASEMHENMDAWLPPVSEDTMPGELGNCIAGRVANLFNLRGPNFVVDAACASAVAAMDASIEGLLDRDYDAVITGGIDRNMSASTYIKFCAIGALSATGTRPYADGADGFVMGEGAALFVLKRLDDAERDGDRVYAVVRGIAGASDGKGKGITAPNPVGQRLAVERAWAKAGLEPSACSLVEGHGTSTRVGDVVEVEALGEAFGGSDLRSGSIALGSVKSNIGHLKGAAGAAGMLKVALALHHKVLPPSLGFTRPNPNVDWEATPFSVNTELRDWEVGEGTRIAGVSAFGFGGTNFHAVLEEHVPGRLTGDGNGRASMAVPAAIASPSAVAPPPSEATSPSAVAPPPSGAPSPAPALKAPPRGALVIGAADEAGLADRLRSVAEESAAGRAPAPSPPEESDLRAPERIAIDYGDAKELAQKAGQALKAVEMGNPAAWGALAGRGVFRGSGEPGKVAFLYTGQGSQYANMLAELRRSEPIVREVFDEADAIMRPLLDGRALSDIVFVDPSDPDAVSAAEAELRKTEITQPAVLTADTALTRLLAAYGVGPDMVMGHSLGEYGALIAAGVLTFEAALEAVSARGREMTGLQPKDPGAMAAVSATLEEVEGVLAEVDGYVVLANVNSHHQLVLGGATEPVKHTADILAERGHQAVLLPVSHAFHTKIVAGASEPLRAVLRRLGPKPPELPVVANVDGEFYPSGPGVEEAIVDILGRQVASPVQFVKGLQTLYDAGARVFVETGPKRALWGFAGDVLGEDAVSLFTNHPKVGELPSFNQALCGLYAAGLGVGLTPAPSPRPPPSTAPPPTTTPPSTAAASPSAPPPPTPAPPAIGAASPSGPASPSAPLGDDAYRDLGRLFAGVLERGRELIGDGAGPPRDTAPVVITGASLGLPGTERIFDDENLARILHGEQLIDVIPQRIRHEILDRHITRLVKGDDGTASFETIDSAADVIKLAARAGELDLAAEFGVEPDRVAALGRATQLAIAAGIDALRDAGIPLVLHYRDTTRGTKLPDRWVLPEELRDDTGVIFASAFPGLNDFAEEVERFWQDHARRQQLEALEAVQARMAEANGDRGVGLAELERRIHDLRLELEHHPYAFDRRFLFRILSMGHSQLAELIGARGPNTQVNAACASTTQAIALAQDWIRAGRCRRVVIVAADDATSDAMLPWIGSGFLASGAAATDEAVEDAALPFDQRRHGMIIGMGAAGVVVESAAAARERGVAPICEVLGAVTANSAFHGTRLDIDHIARVMEQVVAQAEARGISRGQIAGETVFVSHETYTPARGGSAAAEIHALREVFGDAADKIVIANTKGLTGHPMGVGIEDVVAIKSLETGLVPPVPNFRDVDPDLGRLNLSKGGAYRVSHALRLAAGFGSQISMTLLRWTPVRDGRHRNPEELGFGYRIAEPERWNGWLRRVSGQEDPRLEVVQHRLRVVDTGPTMAPQAPAVQPVTAVPLGAPDVEPAAAGAPTAEASAPAPAPTAAAPAPSAPAPAPTAPAAPTVEAAPAATEADPVMAKVLEVLAAETGYPTDMLDPDLDLEADLGIDTVKQAEVFASIREAYNIPRDDSLKLRDYPTLRDVAHFVEERAPQTGEAPSGARAGADEAEGAVAGDGAAGEPRFARRVPVPVVRPPLDRCVPTGVELGEGSRVMLMADQGGVASALAGRLVKRRVEVLAVDDAPSVEELEQRIAKWAESGPIHGVYWLPALDDEGPLEQLDPDAWREGLHLRVKLLAAAMRALSEHVGPSGTFLVSATRLGGRHGYDAAGATSVMGGAVTGFTKALAREIEEALIKAVDFGPSRKTAALADVLVDETLHDPGAVEIGYAEDLRWTVGLVEREVVPDPERALDDGTTFVVTGAAGSIVSAITAELAQAASGGTFHLLDLVPAPDRDDPDLARFEPDHDGLKLELADRMKQRGEKPTPKLVERELARIERAKAAVDAMEAIERAGGTAHWHQVDLTDADAVTTALENLERVDVLLHCAGLEISHFLPDKPQGEYDLVFAVKAAGWFHLLRALRDTPIGTAVAFSSIAARFGNGGQTDYSAANDLLCKSVSHFRREGATRGVAVDWTAWASIGMASRGSIPKMMEVAGIDMLPPAVGIPVVQREITASGEGGEVLVAGSLGILLAERHPTGGLDPEAATAQASAPSGPMTGRIAALTVGDGLVVHTELDPARQAFLGDHRIDGTPVLPGVMGIEGFAEAAAALLPGWSVAAVEDVDLRAPFKFYRDEPRTLELHALLRDAAPDLVADCRLIGRRTVAGQREQETLHFTGRVRLTREPPAPPADQAPPPEPNGDHAVGREDVYRVYFHGPAFQVLDRAYARDGEIVGRFAHDLPPDHEPPGEPTELAPRLIELCFQTAGVYELGTEGRMALPTHVDRVVRYAEADAQGELYAVVRPRGDGTTSDADVVDDRGRVRLRLEGYRTIALPGALDASVLEPMRQAIGASEDG